MAAYYKLTHMNIDIVELDAQGVRVSVELVAHARPADMTRPTPCEDWTLHGLISHMATQHYGFAAAAAGDGDPAAWRPPRLGSDPVADYRASAEAVLSAFSAAGILDRQFPLPEVSVGPIVPAGQAVSFHFVNYVVHSWDVARTLGLDVRFTPGLLEAALRIAEAVPDGETRLAPGSVFAPAVPWQGGPPLDQIVAILGRSPDWKRPELPGLPDSRTLTGCETRRMLGTVARLRRYPVKSMLGEDVSHSGIDAAGLTNDRRLALIHIGTGKVASAKNPRTWRALPTLSAEMHDGTVRITFPDGTSILAADPGADDALSAFLDQPVTLTSTPPRDATLDRAVPEEVLRAGVAAEVPVQILSIAEISPGGTFFDFAPLHMLTNSTLAEIAAHSPSGTVHAERYRPNIVIDTPTPGFTENDWLDRDLRIGADLVIHVVVRTPRCAIPTLQHGPLPRDPWALRVLAQHNRVPPVDDSQPEPCAGVYATVLNPGHVGAGDPVTFA